MSSIIILSEQETLVQTLSTILSSHGITLEHVSDPTKFIQTVSSVKPLMIIIDVAVAGKTGLIHLEELRKSDPSISNIPVMIGEETGDLIVISEALKHNIVDYFVTGKLDSSLVIQKIFKNIPKDSGIVTPESVSKPAAHKYMLLLVEDDRFLRDLAIQKFTADENMTVITAMDGEQGLILAEKHIPHIILLDILLPGIDGFEVLKRIRSKPQFSRTLIVMLSNFGQREDIDKAMALGANQFFIKANYTLDEIVAEVHKLLGIS